MNNLINIEDLTNIYISKILDFSEIFKKSYKNNLNHNIDLTDLDDKVVGLMFFESSTRTNYSFQTALHKLGVKFLNFNDIFSSSNKGETLQDTIKTFECFCDLIIIRHPDKDIFKKIIFEKPVINAGKGSDQHPTQALLDLFTIYEKYLKKSFTKTG